MSHRFDLHTHSDHSDGTYTPAEIVRFAARGHIDLLALTDHDCISGVPEAMAAGKAEGVRLARIEAAPVVKTHAPDKLRVSRRACISAGGGEAPGGGERS